jgi:hypothetical protein
MDRTLVGRCGLYCGACEIYRASRDGGPLRGRIARHFGIKPEQVRCEGCRGLTPDSWGYDCRIVQCLSAKGLDSCYRCGEYAAGGCEEYEELAQRYSRRGVDLRANLAAIATERVEEWLGEQEERWRCPSCGGPISCHEDRCHHCGAPLKAPFAGGF